MSFDARDSRAGLEYSFLSALGPLRQRVRRVYDRELALLGVSVAQTSPLLFIEQHDGLRQGELAQHLEVEGPTLVRLLDQLEAMGLVTRRPDPDDHRAKTIHLTPAGAQLVERVRPLRERVSTRLLSDVTDGELDTCLRVFGHVQAAVEREDAGVPA